MKKPIKLFFDRKDYQLISLVRRVIGSQGAAASKSLLENHLHPQGIKELAAPRELRIAYATASLIGVLQSGHAGERITALRSLRDEVLLSTFCHYQRNMARVLLQIMKELVRTVDMEGEEFSAGALQLAHEFRLASTGKPAVIRRELARYHLLEMPEEWNQLAFDHHVHDANSKGRKRPTHLVLDAWIKGLRQLTVVYYNTVSPGVVKELLTAGELLEIDIQIAIEFSVRFRERAIRFCWEPHGFSDLTDIMKFLQNDAVVDLLAEGKKVLHYQEEQIFAVLSRFNEKHLPQLTAASGQNRVPFSQQEFLHFVGSGQPTLLHLADFIREGLAGMEISLEKLMESYLLPEQEQAMAELTDSASLTEPPLLQLSFPKLLGRLRKLHPASRFVLNQAGLSPQDFLELLYLGGGGVSHIECYNLKTHGHHLRQHPRPGESEEQKEESRRSLEASFALTSSLQRALNEDNVIALKQAVRAIIEDYERQLEACQQRVLVKKDDTSVLGKMKQRRLDLLDLLGNLKVFHTFYRRKRLHCRLGSSSTGRAAEYHFGMGMVVVDTLPLYARKQLKRRLPRGRHAMLPVRAELTFNRHNNGKKEWQDWSINEIIVDFGRQGNIATLGGNKKGKNKKRAASPLFYLNSNLKNSLKIIIGFLPALATFMLTKEWWLLAWFGAPIWFGITGLRNIIQSVLGGGGLRRSPLLSWDYFVNWGRVADSLFFTGFSVPLLDWLVKSVILADGLNITTATSPVVMYAVMGLANGIYISSHNLLRGLPRSAVIGNFFRSVLAIPVAVLLNMLVGMMLGGVGAVGVDAILQKWAAIISKFASDCVAAIIEGLADRKANIDARMRDYRSKFAQVFDVFARLDLLLPEKDTLALLENSEKRDHFLEKRDELLRPFVVNALDLMYFWFYQPRGQKAFHQLIGDMSDEEWRILCGSQKVLEQEKEICQMFVDGLVGANFSRALAFYLNHVETYLPAMVGVEKERRDADG